MVNGTLAQGHAHTPMCLQLQNCSCLFKTWRCNANLVMLLELSRVSKYQQKQEVVRRRALYILLGIFFARSFAYCKYHTDLACPETLEKVCQLRFICSISNLHGKSNESQFQATLSHWLQNYTRLCDVENN